LNLEPIELGHSMIIFKGKRAHSLVDIEKLKTDEWLQLKQVIRNCKRKMRNVHKKDGKPPKTIYFIMLSETEPHHLHFHLIPNYLHKNELKKKHEPKDNELLNFANVLLPFDKEEDYLEKCENVERICKIPTNFGHWYLGLLEMKKNLIEYCKCGKENRKRLHEAAQQMKIHDKKSYLDSWQN
jgi:diadenosine tetraphosphate (Ap4A) HIT family hydrolase